MGRWGRHTAYEGYERFDPRIHLGNYRRDAIPAMAERCVDNVLAVMAGCDPGADSVLNPMVIGHK